MLIWLSLAAGATAIDVALESVELPPGVQSRVETVHWLGGTHVRVQPRWKGLELIGAEMNIDVDPRDGVRQVRAVALGKLPEHTVPTLTQAEAIHIVEGALGIGQWSRLGHTRARLVIFAEDPSDLRLAWAVRVGHAHLNQVWQTFVDAERGTILATEADSWSARGAIFAVNPLDGEPVEVQLLGLNPGPKLDGRFAHAASCTEWEIDPRPYGERICHRWEQTAGAAPDRSFLFVPQYGELFDPFAEVMTYHHTDQIARWAAKEYGVQLDYSIRVLSNFPLTNAFFGDFDGDGRRDLAFGISDDGLNLGYDADVIHHEFGHAIVRSVAGSMWMRADELGIDWTSGALNEGVADTFAMVFNPDPLMAEYMGLSDRWEEAIRDLEPDRLCPDHLQSQVHNSGRIWGSMAYNLIDDAHVGPEIMSQLLMGALPTWSNATNWPDAAASVTEAAAVLHEEGFISRLTHDAVLTHVQASGMADCERIIDLDQVDASEQILLNLGLAADYAEFPLGVQFRLYLPPEATGFGLDLQHFTGVDNGTGWVVRMRSGQPITHAPGRVEPIGLRHAIATEFDLERRGSTDRRLFIDLADHPALVPGDFLYIALASENLERELLDVASSRITVSAWADIATLNAPPAPGKGCSTAPEASPPIPLFFLVLCSVIGCRIRESKTPTQ